MARDDIMKGRYAQTLWDMTARRPLEAITASEIINCTGTARQTFYDHFSSKQALAATCSSSGSLPPPKTALSARRGLKASSLSRHAPPKGPCFSRDSRGLARGRPLPRFLQEPSPPASFIYWKEKDAPQVLPLSQLSPFTASASLARFPLG